MRALLFAACIALSAAAIAAEAKPIVIAHRGASGYLPEHTLEAYAFAYALGADYVEPDLVRTKDGRFVARHDVELDDTTNVAELFPDRKRADGHWYSLDFTLEEIKRLNAHERLPNRFPKANGHFEIPTLEEVVELVQGLNKSTGRDVGIYPEMKSPEQHAAAGLPMEADLMAILAKYGYRDKNAKCFVQCFSGGPLKKLRELKCELPLIMLLGGGVPRAFTEEQVAAMAAYANGIGPDKGMVERQPDMVKWAHAHGLLVHPYTVRRDMKPANYATTQDEYRALFFEIGVDGLFSDFPDDAVKALAEGPKK